MVVAEHTVDAAVSRIAAAIGEPARTRMLYCLMEGHARTSTELAIVAGVAPPTAVEFGRKMIFSDERPSFADLDKALQSIKGG